MHPLIASLRANAEDLRRRELLRTLSSLAHLDERTRDQIDRLTQHLVNKLLHAPTSQIRQAAAAEDWQAQARIIRDLFTLGD